MPRKWTFRNSPPLSIPNAAKPFGCAQDKLREESQAYVSKHWVCSWTDATTLPQRLRFLPPVGMTS